MIAIPRGRTGGRGSSVCVAAVTVGCRLRRQPRPRWRSGIAAAGWVTTTMVVVDRRQNGCATERGSYHGGERHGWSQQLQPQSYHHHHHHHHHVTRVWRRRVGTKHGVCAPLAKTPSVPAVALPTATQARRTLAHPSHRSASWLWLLVATSRLPAVEAHPACQHSPPTTPPFHG